MLRQRRIILVLAVLAALVGTASAWSLDLADSVSVRPGNIRVADLCRSPVPESAGAVVVVPGGRPGFNCEVTRQTILRRLVMAGLAEGVSLQGSARCQVSVNGEALAATELEERIRQVVLPNIPPVIEGAPATWLEIKAPRVNFATDGHWQVVWPEPRELQPGRQLATMQLISEHTRQYISVALVAHVFAQTPQVVAPLNRGQMIAAEHLGWVWTDLAQVDADVVTDPRALQNMLLTRDLMPGQPLRHRDLESRPLVRRGQQVDLVVQRGSVSAVLRAVCRQDGRQGQMVSVMNPLTKRPVLACVSALGVVTMGR